MELPYNFTLYNLLIANPATSQKRPGQLEENLR
jgi:hypothetical protein